MICALCKEQEADKKNTHFLTDCIIRNCLNLDGSIEREKGFYFNLSNSHPFIEFNFQRETNTDKLESSLGRQITDDEIQKAKVIPFSVANVFCSICENIFTEIESKFITKILTKFRNADLSKIDSLNFEDVKLVRLFFYLQVWRISICKEAFKLSDSTAENLRQIIINNKTLTVNQLNYFPLSVTYLQTVGGEFEYTTNFVGFMVDKNLKIIFLNDFVIQFFENAESVSYLECYGLNSEVDYLEFINRNEEQFKIKIFNNEKRKQFINKSIIDEKVKQTNQVYKDEFFKIWFILFGEYPLDYIVEEYLRTFIESEFHILKYTKENFIEAAIKFIENKMTTEN